MKVRITHSIELEEVPEKSAELLCTAEEELNDAVRWLGGLVRDLSRNNIPAEMAVMSLDRIRRVLGQCDQALVEVENILQGVVDYQNQESLPHHPAPQHSSDGFNQMMESMDKDKEQLARDMLRGIKERQDESNNPV